MNDFITIRFRNMTPSVNSIQMDFHWPLDLNYYHSYILTDDKDIYINEIIKNGWWYRYNIEKVFNYNIKLLSFDGSVVKIMDEKLFDMKNHKFTINLKSDLPEELEIWKSYLKIIESSFHTNFTILYNFNDDISSEQDSVEISKEAYENNLIKYTKPITNDYSSLTIIKTLFDPF